LGQHSAENGCFSRALLSVDILAALGVLGRSKAKTVGLAQGIRIILAVRNRLVTGRPAQTIRVWNTKRAI